MALSAARTREIEALSSHMLSEYYGTPQTPFPIEVGRLAEWSGLRVIAAEFEEADIAGCFEPADLTIKVNARDRYLPRIRFTIAHELGHHVLHPDAQVDVLYRRDVDKLGGAVCVPEQEANWFAAALLMPQPCIERFRFIDPQAMAKKFDVSPRAMAYRLKHLGYVR